MILFLFFIGFSFCLELHEPKTLFSVEGGVWSDVDFYEQVFKEDWEGLDLKKKRVALEDFIAQELVVFWANQQGFYNTPEIKKDLKIKRNALLINNTYEHLIQRPLIDRDVFLKSQKNLKHKIEVYHLLVGFSGSEQNTGSTLSKEQALFLIDSLRVEINKEASLGKPIQEAFMSFALEYSEDPSVKTNKGFLGWLPWGHAVNSFQEPVFELKNNTVSDPILTMFGYHLALKTNMVVSNYYYYTPKHYSDLAYKVAQNSLPFDSLKVLASSFDSLLIKNSGLRFQHNALDSLVFFIETKQKEEKMLGNKNILIKWLEAFKDPSVLFLVNNKGFGRLWLVNKLKQTPSSRVPSIKTKEDFQNLILSFVLQEEVLLLSKKEKIEQKTSFLRDWSNNYKNIIYSEYLSYLNSSVSNIDSSLVALKYNTGIYKNKYIKPRQAVFNEVRVFNDSLGLVLEDRLKKGVLFDSLVVDYGGAIREPISSGAKSPLGKAVFLLVPGEVSSVIKNSDGSYSVVRLESFIKEEPFTLDRVYSQIEQDIRREKQDSIRKNIFQDIGAQLSPVINYETLGLTND